MNPINSGNNSMNSLQFFWKARFVDNSEIYQFNKDGSENRFQLVKDKFSDLRYFYLIKKDLSQTFTVDLIHGLIFFNNHQKLIYEFTSDKKNIRLIYKRRNQVYISEKGNLLKKDVWYLLGFQYLDKNNINHKIILQIDQMGNFIIGD